MLATKFRDVPPARTLSRTRLAVSVRVAIGAVAYIYMLVILGLTAPAAVPGTQTAAEMAASTAASRPLDRFGGVGVRVAEPTGHFAVKKIGHRWMFVTPEGNAFWMVGMFDVAPTGSVDSLNDTHMNRVRRKYGDLDRWGQHQVERLKSWGFNATAEYSTRHVLPGNTPDAHLR